jgi:BirA family biotin operon repressor/biotin-[acetyl-CoA-carboxylase] ligase
MYSKEELQQGLSTHVIGKRVFVFETIDSTNACAKLLGEAGTEEGSVVTSDFQTSGRGRHGRAWIANPGENLLFSLLLRPTLSPELAGLLTLFASVAIARGVEKEIGRPIECKWPNDLLLNGKKISGILLENSFQHEALAFSVIGAGLNVNQHEFPTELADRATSLALERKTACDRKHLFQTILQEMDFLYQDVRKGDFNLVTKEWAARCTMFGRQVTVEQHDRTISGIALRLNDDGGLVLETPEGTQTVYAGDVSVVA